MISLIIIPFLLAFISFLTPTGPITVLILRNTLLSKYGMAIMQIFGAAIVQFFFSGLSLFLISEVLSDKLIAASNILSSLVLLVLGIYLIMSKPKRSHQVIHLSDLPESEKLKSFFTGLFVTILNPSIIFLWLAAVAPLVSFNFLSVNNLTDILIFSISAVAGVLTGSFTMMYLIHFYRSIFSDQVIKIVLIFLGIMVIALSIYFLFTAIPFLYGS